MDENGSKSYFLITKMSEAFRRWEKDNAKTLGEPAIQLAVWQIRAQLAIAQQLSIISVHLGEIVERADETEETAS